MSDFGPPRFCAVGETVELAPRSPDPGESYDWSVLESPDDSDLEAAASPVWHLSPDVPGTYRIGLDGPDGRVEQVLRAYPEIRRPARFEVDRAELPEHDPGDVFVMGPFNEQLVGRERPELEGDTYVYDLELPPGTHSFGYVANRDFENAVWEEATVPGPGRPLARLEGDRRDDRVLVTAHASAGTDGEYDDEDLNVEFHVDGRDSIPDGAIERSDREASIDLDALDDDESVRIHAVAVGERHSVPDAVAVRGDGRVDRLNDPPEWARDAIVYEMFVRSFTDGGTFESMERRVPYLEHLGIDCVWLTPVLESPTTHGYHTTDYFDTASDLGTREEFVSFVDRCHEAGIRVVFDLVINHTAREHHAFDMSAAGVPDYEDWYVWEPLAESGVEAEDVEGGREDGAPPSRSLPGRGTEVAQYYFNWRDIPNLNYDSLAVRTFLLSVVDEWVDVVDGYRCDVAWAVSNGFWMEVRDRVKARDPDFLLLDETIPRDPDFAEYQFDVHYDTTLYGALRDVGGDDRPAEAILEAATAPEREGFPDSSLHMRYVENHDESRYLAEYGRAALRAAAGAVLTLPGVPMIYYGQERGATEYRGEMPWEGDADLTAFHRALVAARRSSTALSRGDLVELDYETDRDDAVAFARRSPDETVVVAVNFGSEPATIDLPIAVESADLVAVDGEDGGPIAQDGDESAIEPATTIEVEDVAVRRARERIE